MKRRDFDDGYWGGGAPEPKRPHWGGGRGESEFAPPRDYGPPPLSRGWDGPPSRPPYSGPSRGRGPLGKGPQKQLLCTLHDKMRTESNLEQDADGSWKCLPNSKCRNTGDGNREREREPRAADQNQWKSGDWKCPNCDDHQFARNEKCRMCHCPKPTGPPRGGGGRPPWEADYRDMPPPRDYGPPRRNDWGPPRGGGGWGPPPGDWGPPMDNWGPPRGGGGGGGYRGRAGTNWNRGKRANSNDGDKNPQNEWKSGDWKCPSCGDHQFARNQSCRMCNCPRPEGRDNGPPPGWNEGRRPKRNHHGGGGHYGAGVCHNWADTGRCRFGETCKFSHSADGQKQVQCSEHGKMRTDSNMQPDGNGGFCCRPDSRCRNAGDPPSHDSGGGMRPGDWRCSDCNEHNFASRHECRNCRKPKVLDDGSAGLEGNSAGIFD